jgi:hypothetical protein
MRLLSLIGLLGLLGWGAATPPGQNLLQQTGLPPQATDVSRHAPPLGPYGQLPLSFEANQGQTDDQVQFLARGQGYQLFLTAREAVFAFRPPAAPRGQHPTGLIPELRAVQDMSDSAQAVVRMQLLGANPTPQVVGLEELPGKANYFRGNDPQQWRTNVPTYAKVKYAAVYPGVDLVYYGRPRQLEYDFVVAPGADPTTITLGFEGVDHIDVDAQGDLVLATAGGSFWFQKPVVYQEGDGHRQAIAGGYVRKGPHQVGFHLAAYDPARPLVIDPVLSYSTYLGGSSFDESASIAVDATGAAYITGRTGSADFPTVHPLQPRLRSSSNAFVAKLDATGTALVYATYLGGSSTDQGNGIAIDASGAAYVTGFTFSADFPTVHPLQPAYSGGGDAFVAKLNSAGSALIYATYLGGSGFDHSAGITVDATNAAYVTGQTGSSDFPTVHPLQPTFGGGTDCTVEGTPCGDAFVAKLNAAGSALVYATYLGGSSDDGGAGIAVDAAGAAYVTGTTGSPDFPTVHPLQPTLGGGCHSTFRGIVCDQDAFVAKLETLAFAGTPGTPNCLGQSIAALARQYGGLDAAAAALGFPSVQALQDAIQEFCEG